MNVIDGSVWYAQRSTFGVKALVNEMAQVADWVGKSHPDVKEINLIWDCWSCHFHPQVQLAAHRAGITLIPLPTYTPWENPIEKLWRWLCQEVLHMHDCASQWRTLWDRVDPFLIIQNNEIIWNWAEKDGGGICCTGPFAIIRNNKISMNSAGRSGGGIYYSASSTTPIAIQNNEISKNSASIRGGGICITGSG